MHNKMMGFVALVALLAVVATLAAPGLTPSWAAAAWAGIDTSGCCDGTPGGGKVLTLVISHDNSTPRSSNAPYNHYSLLATIEAGWHLGCLAHTCDYGPVVPMTDLFS